MQTTMAAPHPGWELAIERYRKWRQLQDLADGTREEELRLLSILRAAMSHTYGPHAISEEDVLKFFQTRREKGDSTGTQRHYATAFRQFLRYLGAPGASWIPSFPSTEPENPGRYLTDQERERLWSPGCRTPEDEALLVLGLGAGWRRGDALGARLEDFHPSIEAPQRVTMHGKGEKHGTRTIELHPRVCELVSRYLVYRAALVRKALDRQPGTVDPGTLFVAVGWRDGLTPMGEETFRKRMHRIYERAGVDHGGWPSHNLRRTWADNRLEGLVKFYATSETDPHMALELALRQVCFEGRWKDEKTLRQSYLKRRQAPTAAAFAMTKV